MCIVFNCATAQKKKECIGTFVVQSQNKMGAKSIYNINPKQKMCEKRACTQKRDTKTQAKNEIQTTKFCLLGVISICDSHTTIFFLGNCRKR